MDQRGAGWRPAGRLWLWSRLAGTKDGTRKKVWIQGIVKSWGIPSCGLEQRWRELQGPRSQVGDPRSGSVWDTTSVGCLKMDLHMEAPRRQHSGERQGTVGSIVRIEVVVTEELGGRDDSTQGGHAEQTPLQSSLLD